MPCTLEPWEAQDYIANEAPEKARTYCSIQETEIPTA